MTTFDDEMSEMWQGEHRFDLCHHSELIDEPVDPTDQPPTSTGALVGLDYTEGRTGAGGGAGEPKQPQPSSGRTALKGV